MPAPRNGTTFPETQSAASSLAVCLRSAGSSFHRLPELSRRIRCASPICAALRTTMTISTRWRAAARSAASRTRRMRSPSTSAPPPPPDPMTGIASKGNGRDSPLPDSATARAAASAKLSMMSANSDASSKPKKGTAANTGIGPGTVHRSTADACEFPAKKLSSENFLIASTNAELPSVQYGRTERVRSVGTIHASQATFVRSPRVTKTCGAGPFAEAGGREGVIITLLSPDSSSRRGHTDHQ